MRRQRLFFQITMMMVVTTAMIEKKKGQLMTQQWLEQSPQIKNRLQSVGNVLRLILVWVLSQKKNINHKSSQIQPSRNPIAPNLYLAYAPLEYQEAQQINRNIRTQFFLVYVFVLSDRSLSRMSQDWKSRKLNFIVLQYLLRSSKVETFTRRTKDFALSQVVCQVDCLMSASADQ